MKQTAETVVAAYVAAHPVPESGTRRAPKKPSRHATQQATILDAVEELIRLHTRNDKFLETRTVNLPGFLHQTMSMGTFAALLDDPCSFYNVLDYPAVCDVDVPLSIQYVPFSDLHPHPDCLTRLLTGSYATTIERLGRARCIPRFTRTFSLTGSGTSSPHASP